MGHAGNGQLWRDQHHHKHPRRPFAHSVVTATVRPRPRQRTRHPIHPDRELLNTMDLVPKELIRGWSDAECRVCPASGYVNQEDDAVARLGGFGITVSYDHSDGPVAVCHDPTTPVNRRFDQAKTHACQSCRWSGVPSVAWRLRNSPGWRQPQVSAMPVMGGHECGPWLRLATRVVSRCSNQTRPGLPR